MSKTKTVTLNPVDLANAIEALAAKAVEYGELRERAGDGAEGAMYASLESRFTASYYALCEARSATETASA